MSNQKTEREYLSDISVKLDQVLAMLATSDRSQDEQIQALSQIGWSWKQIGDFVGLKPSTARMRATKAKGK